MASTELAAVQICRQERHQLAFLEVPASKEVGAVHEAGSTKDSQGPTTRASCSPPWPPSNPFAVAS